MRDITQEQTEALMGILNQRSTMDYWLRKESNLLFVNFEVKVKLPQDFTYSPEYYNKHIPENLKPYLQDNNQLILIVDISKAELTVKFNSEFNII